MLGYVQQLPHNWNAMRRDWASLTVYQRSETLVAFTLTALARKVIVIDPVDHRAVDRRRPRSRGAVARRDVSIDTGRRHRPGSLVSRH
jgi:hypothetical protein